MARRTTLDLSGDWRAAPTGGDDLRQDYPEDALDDSAWETVPVPGHWRSTAAFADHDGPLAYRTRFDSAPARPAAGERSFLVVEGVMASADVWLDGTYLGDTAGYAVPHWFEVTDLLARPRRAPPRHGGRLRPRRHRAGCATSPAPSAARPCSGRATTPAASGAR